MKRCASSVSDISSEKNATGLPCFERDVVGDVDDHAAVVDDHVIGNEVVMVGDGEVEGLLLPNRLYRDDLVPPHVRLGQMREAIVITQVNDLRK